MVSLLRILHSNKFTAVFWTHTLRRCLVHTGVFYLYFWRNIRIWNIRWQHYCSLDWLCMYSMHVCMSCYVCLFVDATTIGNHWRCFWEAYSNEGTAQLTQKWDFFHTTYSSVSLILTVFTWRSLCELCEPPIEQHWFPHRSHRNRLRRRVNLTETLLYCFTTWSQTNLTTLKPIESLYNQTLKTN